MSDPPPAAAPDEGVAVFHSSWQGAAGSRLIKCGLPNAECGMTTQSREQ
jgi:hypothetical protein